MTEPPGAELTHHQGPDDAKLARAQAELAVLEAQLAQRELDLATLRAELVAFEGRYLRRRPYPRRT